MLFTHSYDKKSGRKLSITLSRWDEITIVTIMVIIGLAYLANTIMV